MAKETLKKIVEHLQKPISLALLGGGLLTCVLYYFNMFSYEATLYDLRMRLKLKESTRAPIKLVVLDQKTINSLKQSPPLPISTHLEILQLIQRQNPKLIAFMLDFQPWVIQSNEEAATQFVSLSKKTQNIFIGTDYDFEGEKIPPYPLSQLPHSISVINRDGNDFAKDNVSRKGIVSISGHPTLDSIIANQYLGITSPQHTYMGQFHHFAADADFVYINYTGGTDIDKQPYEAVSYVDVLNNKVSKDFFKDQIVLIGSATFENSYEYTATPYNKEAFTNPNLVVHAHTIDTLIKNRGIVKAPKWANILLTFAISCSMIYLILTTTPIIGVLATFSTMAIIFLLGLIAFRFFYVWIEMTHPLFGVFFSYYIFVPHRAIIEYQKRWNLQKRNELLTQVEELKSNFMSLMSHDLKTPVAEIQGLAEYIRIKGELNSEQKIGLEKIIESTEDLNNFITSILDMAKIESRKIKLNKKSKDLNKIIENVIQKLKFQADRKHIKILAELEPLFPTLIDDQLITRVMSNLIENSIKYSPEGSSILISSTEVKDKIKIKIKDQGPGIKREFQENVFTKFYRIKNDETLKTKGTGLGLYLVKYFVELHKGEINLSSEPGNGSEFTISLPVQSA